MDLDESDDGPATIFFATIPFEYLADTADLWAEKGVEGFMLAGIMRNWDSDVWQVDGKRVTGERNPLLRRLRRMNETCASHGVNRNFVKVAFYSHLPDWFDEDGWNQLLENFRQGAAITRDALFRGMAIDIEYVNEIYDLSWPAYSQPGYPLSGLREKAQERGVQIVQTMLDEYPEMEILHVPQSPECYGGLASDLFAGMCSGMAGRDAPGGLHLLTEATYQRTDVDWLFSYGQSLDELVEEVLPESSLPYWREKCSISFGLWPLGYYRKVYDGDGKFLGYSGKREMFGDQVVGSTADKSENYGVEEFRKQFAAARMICEKYVWIYCHGSTFWQLNQDEMQRYGGSSSDALPVVEDLDEYIEVLRRRQILSDDRFSDLAAKIRSGARVDFLGPSGSPRVWSIIGPFDNERGKGFSTIYPPERELDLSKAYEGAGGRVRWQRAKVSSTGYLDLCHLFRPSKDKLAYAFCKTTVPELTNARVLLGSDDGAKVWIDGRLIFQLDVVRGATPDEDEIPVRLPKGTVSILLKITNFRGSWGFYFRIVDASGRPPKGMAFSPT